MAQGSEKALQLQPGDRLDITVFREDDISSEYEIDPAGKLTFPLIGEIRAAGLPIDVLRDELIQKLKKYLIDPQVSISRVETKVKTISSISILGHVVRPASFDYAPGTTLMRIVSQAEGFAPSANKRKIRIVRMAGGSKESFSVNAQDIIDGKIEDPELQPGDMIFVPESIF
jgi:polysaccharide export outer membrane protein